jgi:V8-like Glu-specific endopeptidase
MKALFLLALAPFTASAAVFGPDTRMPVVYSPYVTTARSVAVAVLSANISESTLPGKLKLSTEKLGDLVCKDEKFASDPSLSYSCTGFLVAPDLLVTAGHCSVNTGVSENETETYCQTFSWLFDYQADVTGKVNLDKIDASKHYKCKRTIFAVREEEMPYRDFALIQLDRPVADRKPLKLNGGPIGVGEQVSMLGFPLGVPMKYSGPARVILNNKERESFLTNLSAFEGNSGSPIFNAKQEVVGILVAGTPSPSLYDDKALSCQRYNRCDLDAKNCLVPDTAQTFIKDYQGVGSEVQRIQPVIDLINKELASRR